MLLFKLLFNKKQTNKSPPNNTSPPQNQLNSVVRQTLSRVFAASASAAALDAAASAA